MAVLSVGLGRVFEKKYGHVDAAVGLGTRVQMMG